MTDRQKAQIRAWIETAIRAGFKIHNRLTFREESGLCCALGAWYCTPEGGHFLDTNPDFEPNYSLPGHVLGLTIFETRAFVCGFDGDDFSGHHYEQSAYQFGRELAQEFGVL